VGTLSTTYSPNHRPTAAEYRRMAYLSNGWDKCKRWNGRTAALEDAGIAGPSRVLDSWQPAPTEASGTGTIGVHVVRYRYMDSRTGYVSNASEEREVTMSSTKGKLTFTIGASGSGVGNIIRSTDSKVDRIVVEMTVVGDNDAFFKAAEGLNSAATIVVDIEDSLLEEAELPWDDVGHEPPPVAKVIVSHRDRLWLFGQVVHEVGTASFTNGSLDVAEGSTAPDWRATALGDRTAVPATYPSVTFFVERTGDGGAEYEIDTYDESLTKLIMKKVYAGVTGANVAYRIFTRANVIWISRPGYPESFQPLKFLNGPNNEMAGDLVAGVGYGSSMIFFSLSGMFQVAWDSDPLVDSVYIPLSNKYGALSQRVALEVEGSVYSMDRLGWTQWQGVFPRLISRPVEAIKNLIDYDRSELFHAVFFPNLRAIRWYVCYTGDTNYPQHYVQFDIDTNQWSTGALYHEVSESRLVPTQEGPKVLLGDGHGHTWYADVGTCDGCAEADSHKTAAAGCTATVLQITGGGLPTTGGIGLAGCYLQWRKSNGTKETARILSNTATAITLASALSAIPAAAEVFWIGPIPALLKTRAYSAASKRDKRRDRFFTVEFTPEASVRYYQVRAYQNLSATPQAWATVTGRNNPPGLVWPGGNTRYPTTDFLVDGSQTDAQAEVPLGSDWRRFVEVEVECEEPDAVVEIVSLEIDGSTREDRN
jgi:hypothetical protein